MTHVDKHFSQLAIDQVKRAINFAPGTVNSELVKQLFDRIDDLESEVQTKQNSIDELRKTLEMDDQILVSREVIQQAIVSLEYFASQMTVGQRYTNEGQTVIDAPVELREAMRNQPKSNIHGRKVGNVRYFDKPEQVPLLTDDEIHSEASKHWDADGVDPIAFARDLEKTWRQKAGLK